MGTGRPGPWGTDTHLSSWPSPSHAHPPVRGQLLWAVAASRDRRAPSCRKVPGEKSQGFPPRRSRQRGSRAWRGLSYTLVTPG